MHSDDKTKMKLFTLLW